MFESGYLKLGKLRGTPIRVHWTMPVGALIFSGFRFAPVFWLAFFGLVLLHELGHAALVRRFGHHVITVDITGFGGLCRWAGRATPFERAAIAWGGVGAQGLLLIATLLVLLITGRPTSLIGAQLASVFVTTNLLLIGLNLLPFPPLDGAEAWQLVKHLRGGRGPRPPWLGGGRRGSGEARTPPRGVGEPPSRTQGSPPRTEGSPPRSDGGSPRRSNGGSPPRELADVLRQIGDEAGRARRGSEPERRR